MYKRERKRVAKKEAKYQQSINFSARSELLLPEQSGFIEPDENEETYQISQEEIVSAVDISSATKHFDLKLTCGSYEINYFRNGRNLLIGGEQGHVAALDWVTKDLLCEFNVQESVHDVQWLHMPTMFAVAQKDWVHIYDSQGTQLHCLKKMYRVIKMDFLPYHFLLVGASDIGFISWIDVSIGKMVNNFKMKTQRVMTMKQNPSNAIILTGHTNGTVSMWSPNQNTSLASMLCSGSALRDLAVTDDGAYLATSGVDRTLRIWDLRTFKCLRNFKLRSIPGKIDFSQRNLLAISMGNVVEIYRNPCIEDVETPYLRHRLTSPARNVQFCNYEDVLGIGHNCGFTSILVPGAGEPNFDAFESNPFMTNSQKREMEVKALLEKISPDLITLDPGILGTINVEKLKGDLERKEKELVKVPKVEFVTKHRQKTAQKTKIAKLLREQEKMKRIKLMKAQEQAETSKQKNKETKEEPNTSEKHVLDRFKPKM